MTEGCAFCKQLWQAKPALKLFPRGSLCGTERQKMFSVFKINE